MPDENLRLDEIEKAVAAHPSFLQQRRAGRFVTFDTRREQPRDAGGRFAKRLSEPERAEATRLAERERGYLERQLQNHMGDLRAGRLDASTAASRGQEAIAEYYERMLRLGMQAAGNPGVLLTARDKIALSRIVRDESDFWQSFMADVAHKRGVVDYAKRTSMYANAAQEAFWTGWVLGDFRAARRIRWVLGETDASCETCLGLSKKGPMDTATFIKEALGKGYVPQAGALACRGIHCKCRLEETE